MAVHVCQPDTVCPESTQEPLAAYLGELALDRPGRCFGTESSWYAPQRRPSPFPTRNGRRSLRGAFPRGREGLVADPSATLAPRTGLKAEARLSPRMAQALRLLALPRGELAKAIREAAERNPAVELSEPPVPRVFARNRGGFAAAAAEEVAAESFLDHYRRGLAATALLPEERRAVAVVLSALSADGEATLSAEETAREAGVPLEAARAALAAVADCGPPPRAARAAGSGGGESDISIFLDKNGNPAVRPAEEGLPRVGLSRELEALLEDPSAGAETKKYAKEKLSEANFLLTALGLRKRTLERVGEEIARAQAAFFREGPPALVPLSRRAVAKKLGVAESTVSRAVAGKWAETPWGMKPLAYFFDTGISPGARETLRRLVAAEPPEKPLSDEALRRALARGGVVLSRRTVAKYRAAAGIPGAAARKELRRSLGGKAPR